MKAFVALLALTLSGQALAQARQCHILEPFVLPTAERPPDEPVRGGPVAGYTLALSWSPAFCAHHPDSRPDDGQCDPANGHFGFIVHGLWPEGEGRNYPQWCAPAPPIPDAVARAQYCVTPSPRLIAHEWAKHGICATRDPAQYYATTRRLFAALRFPDMAALGGRRITVGRFKQLFVAANPTIPASALSIQNNSGLLHEVRICLGRTLVATPCPKERRGPPDQAQIVVARGN